MEEVEKEIILDELRRTLEGENRRLSENYADVCLESVLQTKRIVDLEEALRGIASTANANKYTHEAALLCALSSIEDMALDALALNESSEARSLKKLYRRGEKAVKKFAEGMLAKLAKRSDRGAWLDETLEALLFALEHELVVEVKGGYRSYQKGTASLEDLQEELYDVGNYCMMASDKIDEMLAKS